MKTMIRDDLYRDLIADIDHLREQRHLLRTALVLVLRGDLTRDDRMRQHVSVIEALCEFDCQDFVDWLAHCPPEFSDPWLWPAAANAAPRSPGASAPT